MNLLTQPWLRVQRRNGSICWIAPADLTSDYANNPVVTPAYFRADLDSAAHQFLIGLLQTVNLLQTPEDLQQFLENPPSTEELQQRFQPIEKAFNITGEGYLFMQEDSPRVRESAVNPIATLLLETPGNQTQKQNKDILVKRGKLPTMGLEAAAMCLFSLQISCASGGVGHRVTLRGGGPLVTLLQFGDSDQQRPLWDNLLLNVLDVENYPDFEWDQQSSLQSVFPWMGPVRSSEKTGGLQTTHLDVHPLQMYWAMPRRILLMVDEAGGDCTMTGTAASHLVQSYYQAPWGVNYVGNWEHPLSPTQLIKDERYTIHLQPEGLSFRRFAGLILRDSQGARQPALVIQNMQRQYQEYYWDDLHSLGVWACGYDLENMKCRGLHSSYRMPFIAVEPEIAAQLSELADKLIDCFDAGASSLLIAFKQAHVNAGNVRLLLSRKIEPLFYETLLQNQKLLEANAGADELMESKESWLKDLIKEVLTLFEKRALLETVSQSHLGSVYRAYNGLRRAIYGANLRSRLGLPKKVKAETTQQETVQ